jgi:peptidoglycan/LPS O-acetylase OafA/YrhL
MRPPLVFATPKLRSIAATNRGRITVLDGWRGISIMLVVFGHLIIYRYLHQAPFSLEYRVVDALATLGVCIFFVISGLIITKLALREQEASGRFSARNFYRRRFFRIVPPYFLYLSCILLLTASGAIRQSYSGMLWAAGFLCNLPQPECGWFVGHSWSLAYEEQFYLVFPLLIVCLGRRMPTVICVMLAGFLALPVLRYVLHLGGAWYAVCHATFYLSFICAGALLATFGDRLQEFHAVRHIKYIVCFVVLLLIGLVLIESLARAHPDIRRYQQGRMLLVPTLEPLCIAWFIAVSLHAANWVTRSLNSWLLQFIGMISYSLYLWQQLFTGDLSDYLGMRWLTFAPLMIVFATLSYYFVERPAARFAKRIAGGSRTAGHVRQPAKA